MCVWVPSQSGPTPLSQWHMACCRGNGPTRCVSSAWSAVQERLAITQTYINTCSTSWPAPWSLYHFYELLHPQQSLGSSLLRLPRHHLHTGTQRSHQYFTVCVCVCVCMRMLPGNCNLHMRWLLVQEWRKINLSTPSPQSVCLCAHMCFQGNSCSSSKYITAQ